MAAAAAGRSGWAALGGCLGRTLSRQSDRSGGCHQLCAGVAGQSASAPQAVAVLEQASLQNPKHMGLLGAYGRALADIGNYKQALDVLNRAHAPDNLIGASSLCRARCSIRWAGMRKPSATTRPRSGSCRTSLRFCPISAFPTRFQRSCSGRGYAAAGSGTAARRSARAQESGPGRRSARPLVRS